MFWNKEAVQKIKELRKARKEGMGDEEFDAYLKREFGAGLGEQEKVEFTEDEVRKLVEEQEEKKSKGSDYGQLEDLDDIRIVKPANLNKDASQQ